MQFPAVSDGTTHVALAPEVLLERLIALVPRPRKHLVTYHGVLAPAAGIRAMIVPQGNGSRCRHVEEGEEGTAEPAATCRVLGPRAVPHAPSKRRRGGAGRRYRWAELLARVFLVDVLACQHWGGRRKVLAAIHDPDSIRRVLEALALEWRAPELTPARGPPGEEWGWV